MPINKIYIYERKYVLTLTDNGINTNMFTDSIKIHKGINDKITFQVYDENRRPVNISELTLSFNVIDSNAGKLLFQKSPVSIDNKLGKFDIVFSYNDTINLDNGLYEYSITSCDVNDNQGLAYVDVSQNAIGSIELIEGVIPTPAESNIIDQFVSTNTIDPNDIEECQSHPINISSTKNHHSTLHTFAVYGSNNWTGVIYVEGSLDAGTPNNWFKINLDLNGAKLYVEEDNNSTFVFDLESWKNPFNELIFDNSCPLDSVYFNNFRISCNWLRFVYKNAIDNKGNLLKILHRN